MTTQDSSTETLDVEELLHLALDANEGGDGEKVINYLKRLLALQPGHGMALYLLGAQHAQMRMYDRAKEEMARAVEVEPNIPPTAHFQLGLLHLTSGEVPQAMAAWSPLEALEENDALFLFQRGLTALIRDDFAGCIADLQAGIGSNDLYPALNADMQLFIDRARAAMDAQPEADEANTVASESSRRANLSAYESDSDG